MKRGKHSRSQTTTHNKKVLRYDIILIMLFVVIIIMGIVLLVQTHLLRNPLNELSKTTERFDVGDSCSIIAGKLIHTIGDEGICENFCYAECETRRKEYQRSEFTQNTDSCNDCTCYCR